MLTQEDLVDDEDPVGEPREEKAERMPKAKKGMMMMTPHQGDMSVPRILSHKNPDGHQQRTSWTRILIRTTRYG